MKTVFTFLFLFIIYIGTAQTYLHCVKMEMEEKGKQKQEMEVDEYIEINESIITFNYGKNNSYKITCIGEGVIKNEPTHSLVASYALDSQGNKLIVVIAKSLDTEHYYHWILVCDDLETYEVTYYCDYISYE